jgi:hypothetical protein
MKQSIKNNLFLLTTTLLFVVVIVLIIRGPTSPPKAKPSLSVKTTANGTIPEKAVEVVNFIKNIITPDKKPELLQYIQITDGCGVHFQGSCVNVRTAPNKSAHVAYKLRNGIILRVSDKVTVDGRDWYKVYFDEWLRYPERAGSDLYVAADFVTPFLDEGRIETKDPNNASSAKHIIVDRSEQMLYAYDGDELFMKQKVSTGIELTPTPRGNFTVYKKTPSRYMQGPIPGISTHYYDLPGVPWDLYFSEQGAVIHGAYWHDSFGQPWSNGCVNLPIASAEKLYKWASVGTKVLVRD